MAIDIKFDGVSISDPTADYPRLVDHANSTERNITFLPLPFKTGGKIVDARYTQKIIHIEGIIIGTSASDFEEKCDAMKELLSRPGKNLDIIPYAGDINGRRYIAICQSHTLPLDYSNITWVNYTADFLAPEGYGRSTVNISDTNSAQTSSPVTKTLTIIGSLEAYPVLTITVNSQTTLTDITIATDADANMLDVPSTYGNGDILIVNFENWTITKNGTAIAYTGGFPRWASGSTTYTITFTAAAFNADINVSYPPLWL